MAEYIEREALKERLEDFSKWCKDGRKQGVDFVLDCPLPDMPTADVVPKSEEGAECPTCYGTGRIGTTDWLTKNISKKQLAEEKAKAIAEHEQYIKTEYAREIFEEIEKTIRAALILIGFSYKHQAKEMECRKECYEDFLGYIDELKKKYTENC